MIGVNITSKTGLLLFSHFFIPGVSGVNEDLRAGLFSAVLNAVKEGISDTGIKTISQGTYFVHIVEGKYTYGLFFSYENDLKEYKFANTILQQFELQFYSELEENVLSFLQDSNEFEKFQEYLNKQYNALISIDVVGLSKIIEIMEDTNINDYIVLEKPYLHQVFTAISNQQIHPYANQLALMCKNVIEAGTQIEQEITDLQFNLGKRYYVILNQLGKYILILLINQYDKDRAFKELMKIHDKLNHL